MKFFFCYKILHLQGLTLISIDILTVYLGIFLQLLLTATIQYHTLAHILFGLPLLCVSGYNYNEEVFNMYTQILQDGKYVNFYLIMALYHIIFNLSTTNYKSSLD